MPGFLSEYDQTETLTFGADKQWWVKIQLQPNHSQSRRAQRALLQPIMSIVGTDSNTSGEVDFNAFQDEQVYAAVLDWNLTDKDGAPMPLEPEAAKRASIDALPDEVFDAITAKFKKPEVVKKGDVPADPFREGGAAGNAAAERRDRTARTA